MNWSNEISRRFLVLFFLCRILVQDHRVPGQLLLGLLEEPTIVRLLLELHHMLSMEMLLQMLQMETFKRETMQMGICQRETMWTATLQRETMWTATLKREIKM